MSPQIASLGNPVPALSPVESIAEEDVLTGDYMVVRRSSIGFKHPSAWRFRSSGCIPNGIALHDAHRGYVVTVAMNGPVYPPDPGQAPVPALRSDEV